MSELSKTFNKRLLSEQNTVMLGNLACIVAAHDERPIGPDDWHEEETKLNVFDSASGSGKRVIIDRGIEIIASQYDISTNSLVEFAGGGAVLDVGSGQSSFLDMFKGTSETVAVDTSPENIEFQKSKGHRALKMSAAAMDGVESESVRLLNASWSLPFWSVNTSDARKAQREYTRVLESGGIALIGPVTRRDLHADWEYTLEVSRYNDKKTGPWLDGDNAFMSHTLSAFIDEVLRLSAQGNLFHGHLDVVGSRSVGNTDDDYRGRVYPVHVPNYLMIRKS